MTAKSYPELTLSGVWEMVDNDRMAGFLELDAVPTGGAYCMQLDEFSGKGRIQFLAVEDVFTIRFRRPSGELYEKMPVTLIYDGRERVGHVEVTEGLDRRPRIYLHFADTKTKRAEYGGYNGVLVPGSYRDIAACMELLREDFERDAAAQPGEAPQGQ